MGEHPYYHSGRSSRATCQGSRNRESQLFPLLHPNHLLSRSLGQVRLLGKRIEFPHRSLRRHRADESHAHEGYQQHHPDVPESSARAEYRASAAEYLGGSRWKIDAVSPECRAHLPN
jgi:hypothetical protein